MACAAGGASRRRRGPSCQNVEVRYEFGDCVLDTDSYQLLRDGDPVHLEPGAFEVLAHLIAQRDRIVSKNELLDEIWGDRFVSESALTTRIKQARQAVGDDGAAQQMIKTTHGRGYRFVGEVTELGAGTTTSLVDQPEIEQRIHFCHTHDCLRLAYAVMGDGPVLVRAAHWLTHLDYDWHSPVWHHWLADIARDRTLVRYDERGCGLSDLDLTHCTLDDWVADLKAVVDSLELERFPLLGVSQGGPVAIAFAARYPERVSKLVLMNTYCQGRHVRAQSHDDRSEAEVQLELVRLGWERDDPTFRRFFTSSIMPDATVEYWDNFAELLRPTSTAENAVKLISTWRSVDISDEVGRVRCPAIVMHSRGDLRVPFEQGRELAALLPDSRFVPLDSMNHLLRVDEPAWQRFLDELDQFLGD